MEELDPTQEDELNEEEPTDPEAKKKYKKLKDRKRKAQEAESKRQEAIEEEAKARAQLPEKYQKQRKMQLEKLATINKNIFTIFSEMDQPFRVIGAKEEKKIQQRKRRNAMLKNIQEQSKVFTRLTQQPVLPDDVKNDPKKKRQMMRTIT